MTATLTAPPAAAVPRCDGCGSWATTTVRVAPDPHLTPLCAPCLQAVVAHRRTTGGVG